MVKRATVVGETNDSDLAQSPLIPMSMRELLTALGIGLAVGVTVYVLMYLLNTFVFGSVLCRPQSAASCNDAPGYAMVVAMILGAIGGLAGLAQARVYRPLVVVLAATISLWGLQGIMQNVAWYWAVLVMAGLFGVTYALFTWIMRLRSFVLTLVVTIVLVVLIRLVMVS